MGFERRIQLIIRIIDYYGVLLPPGISQSQQESTRNKEYPPGSQLVLRPVRGRCGAIHSTHTTSY
jgi:hypothetical protein